MSSSNASASAFGWEFQANAAIVLMLKNMQSAASVRVEGATEDVEITLNNGQKIYSQAKSVFNLEDTNNLNEKLTSGLRTLSIAQVNDDAERLIYITNSPNPFNNIRTIYAFSSGYNPARFHELPEACKKKIISTCEKNNYNIDFEKLSVCVMQFHGDNNDIRYKVVKDVVSEFLESINLSRFGITTKVLTEWQRTFSNNSTKSDITITITKEAMVWPLVALLCDFEEKYLEISGFDDCEIEEIKDKYEMIINNNSENFEFISKVRNSYDYFKPGVSSRIKAEEFIETQWGIFKEEFETENMEQRTLEGLIKLTIKNIIDNRNHINKIKKGVNL